MHIIRHRVNKKTDLSGVLPEYGIETDLRTEGQDIILHHDAFNKGENFEEFLREYNHSGIILNTKVDGIEKEVISLMERFNINEYFFLDLPLPSMVKLIKSGCNKIAIRYSEYEPVEFVKSFQGMAEWVWVDCFSRNMLTPAAYEYLHKHFKICVVSPELQQHPYEWIEDFKIAFEGFEIDAVCTKRPDLWK